MPSDIGPRLLGRRYVADANDFAIEDYLATDPLIDAAVQVAQSHAAKSVKAWIALATPRLAPPAPSPAPPPLVPPTPTPVPATDIEWADTDPVLDQGDTPHCVGFGWAQWGNTLPVDSRFTDADGNAIYAECKVIDGEPGAEDGSDVRSGAKAMQNRGALKTYAFSTDLQTVRKFLDSTGPVVFGTDWTDDMFTPDAHGVIRPTGAVAGGHCFVCVGDLVSEGALEFQNSWGAAWGNAGRFSIAYHDVVTLLNGIESPGEACAAVQVA